MQLMEFILDTNAYRNLATSVKPSYINAFASRLKLGERRKESQAALSIVVAMELIQHLVDGDPFQQVYYDALRLQLNHTNYYNFKTRRFVGNYYPPMNVILAQHYFGENSKYLDLYDSVMQLI